MDRFPQSMERIAALLEEKDRERFYALTSRLKAIPEDDELLLVIEAIGFMTLIWREVPEQVERVLASARPPDQSPPSTALIVNELKAAVTTALDVPTYADMRRLASQWEEQHALFKASLARLASSAGNLGTATGQAPFVSGMFYGLLIGVALCLGAGLWLNR